jgi:hypothetical protein
MNDVPIKSRLLLLSSFFIWVVVFVSILNTCNDNLVSGFTSTSSSKSAVKPQRSTSLSLYPLVNNNHNNNFLSIRKTQQLQQHYATTQQKEEEKSKLVNEDVVNGETEIIVDLEEKPVNGDSSPTVNNGDSTKTTTINSMMIGDFNASTQIIELMDEISRRINEGSTELVQNISSVVDEQMQQLPESAAQELAEYIGDLANKIQKAQQEEVERQLEELEKIFVQPLERVAFSDAPLFELDQNKPKPVEVDPIQKEIEEERKKLVFVGVNSTLPKSARMRTSEIIRNFNVAPLYYSVTLLYRWFRKASVS